MKRPDGFDPPPEPRGRGLRAVARTPRSSAGVRERPPEAATPRSSTGTAARRRKASGPIGQGGDAEPLGQPGTAALRAAQRARRQAERAEIRRFTRTARRRRIGWIAALSSIGGILGIVALLAFSPLLALRTIEVEGTVRLDEAQIAAALEGELGRPLVTMDDARIADELGGFPLIRSFVIEIVPPGTMRVRVEEREPIGVVASGPVFQLVDPAGIVIQTSRTRPDGVPLLELPVGDDGTVRESVAEVLLALPDEVLERVDRIAATTRDDVAFTMRDSDQRVVWGSAENSERKALVLAALLDKWGGKGPGEYDVSGSGSATFRQL